MPRRWRSMSWGIIIVALWLVIPRLAAQDHLDPGVCADVRYMMQQGVTMSDLMNSGTSRALTSELTASGDISAGDAGDYWYFAVTNPEPVTLHFNTGDVSFPLEFAVFRGMRQVREYAPVNNNSAYVIDPVQIGIYTIVVRLSRLADNALLNRTSQYTIRANYAGSPNVADFLPEVVDAATAERYEAEVSNGLQIIDEFPRTGATVTFHAGTLSLGNNVSSSPSATSARTQVFFNNGGAMLLNNWAQHISYAAGDLSVRGTVDGRERIYYVEHIDIRENITTSGDLLAFTDSSGLSVSLDWSLMTGFWMTRSCAGLRLDDGRTFIVALDQNRTRSFQLTPQSDITRCDTIRAHIPEGQLQICLPLGAIQSGTMTSVAGNIFRTTLRDNRSLTLASTDFVAEPLTTDAPPNESFPLIIQDNSNSARYVLDWVNLTTFTRTGADLWLGFADDVRRQSGLTQRTGTDITLVDARDDVIQIQYASGAERLLLPRSESYLEIVTPAGEPTFNAAPYNSRTIAGEAGYAPRPMNNTGGECYPVNTTLQQASCGENGHINPANGNLWYAVTDLTAYAPAMPLNVTRSYNSGLYRQSGPFGRGWSTAFPIDYPIAFDQDASARQIIDNAANNYALMLDLTWVPRGMVMMTTASGSQHVFIEQRDNVFTALTMPDWTLQRDSIRSNWLFSDGSGYVIEFDRAGRIITMAHPAENHRITISYPRDEMLEGMGGIEASPVIITDAPDMRQIELYFNQSGFIERAVLRDLTASSSGTTCTLDQNCLETQYSYTDDLLTGVTYPDGIEATYAYDARGRLIFHDDPRAPVHPRMAYSYQARERGVAQAYILNPDEMEPTPDSIVWRALIVVENGTQRTVSLTDEFSNTRYFTYALSDDEWDEIGTSFTLKEALEPLASLGGYNALPLTYEWENGLLVAQEQRGSQSAGRSRTNFIYAPDSGALVGLRGAPGQRGGYPNFSIQAQGLEQAGLPASVLLPQSVEFADGTSVHYRYDNRGRLHEAETGYGAIYVYTYNSQGGIQRVTLYDATQEPRRAIWRREYTYHETLSGLTGSVAQYSLRTGEDPGHIITYEWDAFGRLVSVQDSVAGTYRITYSPPQPNGSTIITVTDPATAITTTTFDVRGRITEQVVMIPGQEGDFRRTTYQYDDPFGRLTAINRWLDDTPITTTYDYQQEAVTGSLSDLVIIENSPTDGTISYRYDAIGRIKAIQDRTGFITEFEYSVTDVESPLQGSIPFGLRIEQTQRRGDVLLARTRYVFEERWQLIYMEREVYDSIGEVTDRLSWQFLLDSNRLDSTHYRRLESATSGLNAVEWATDRYNGLSPGNVDVRSASVTGPATRKMQQTAVDYLGRVTRIEEAIDDERSVTYTLAYCPAHSGSERILISQPDVEITCSSPASQTLYMQTHDAYGRLTAIRDEFGERIITYSVDPDAHLWTARVELGAYSWALDYDPAGKLVNWRTSRGQIRTYAYDTLGRLTGVTTTLNGTPQPEETVQYTYNAAGQVIEKRDAAGRGERYNYDDAGNLTLVQNIENGQTVVYTYDIASRLTSIISPGGTVQTITYDYADRVAQIVAPDGTSSYQWDIEDRLLRFTDPRGVSVAYQFDVFNLLEQAAGPLNRSSTFTYNSRGQITGLVSAYDDAAYRYALAYEDDEIQISTPETEWGWTLAISPAGKITEVAGGNSDRSELDMRYDAGGRLTAIYDASNVLLWSADHAPGSTALNLTTGSGDELTLNYDTLYRLTGISTDRQQIEYSFNTAGTAFISITGEEAPRIYAITRGDGINPPRMTMYTSGERVTYNYNIEGRVESIERELCVTAQELPFSTPDVQSDPGACQGIDAPVQRTVRRFSYDPDGNPVRIVDEEQNVQTFTYDPAGNLLIYQNEDGDTFTYTYDRLNRLVSLTTPSEATIFLAHNRDQVSGICRSGAGVANNYAECVENNGLIEQYIYDAAGNIITRTFPNAGEVETASIQSNYDDTGQLTGWSAEGNSNYTVGVLRNAFGAIEQALLGNETQYFYEYTADQRLERVEIDDAVIEFEYDAQGRITRLQSPDGALSYTYAANGYRITDEQSGSYLTYEATANGLLRLIDYGTGSPSAENPLLNITYTGVDDNGTIGVLLEWDDDFATALQFNRQGRATFVQHIAPDPVPDDYNLRLVYTRSPSGKEQSVVYETDGDTMMMEAGAEGYLIVYGYDEASKPQLLRINDTGPGGLLYLQNITYSSSGRITRESRQFANGTRQDIAYQYQNSQLTGRQITLTEPESSPSSAAGERATTVRYEYRYDAAGNLAIIRANDRTCATFQYDAMNRLVRTTTPDVIYRYAYSPAGQLIAIDDTQIVHSAAGNGPVFIRNEDDTLTYATSSIGNLFIGQPDGLLQTITDGNGTTIGVRRSDANADPQPVWLFDPFKRFINLIPQPADNPCIESIAGEPVANLPEIAVIDGMIWHTRANLYFHDGRVYSPDIGRYLQRDLLGPDAQGSVYNGLSPRLALPVHESTPPLQTAFEGLSLVQDVHRLAHSLSASQIEALHAPAPVGYRDSLPDIARIRQLQRQVNHVMMELHNLPVWLTQSYNLRGARIDPQTGGLLLALNETPGNNASNTPDMFPDVWHAIHRSPIWAPDRVALPADTLASITQQTYKPVAPVSSYLSHAWLPDQTQLADVLQAPQVILPHNTPAAVLSHLPQAPTTINHAQTALKIETTLKELKDVSVRDWFALVVWDALPRQPDVVPLMDNGNLSAWFSLDTFGIQEALQAHRLPQILPQLPDYSLQQPTIDAQLSGNIYPHVMDFEALQSDR